MCTDVLFTLWQLYRVGVCRLWFKNITWNITYCCPAVALCRSSVPIFLPILLLALTEESADIRSAGMQQVEGVAMAYSALQVTTGGSYSCSLAQHCAVCRARFYWRLLH